MEDAVAVDDGEERSVGDAATDAATVGVSVAITVVVAAGGSEEARVVNGVGRTNSALDDGDGLGVAVSASGMINGGNVGIAANVGVGVMRGGVGVCDEN